MSTATAAPSRSSNAEPVASVKSSLPAGRIVSLDQFRGYTVVGMLLVNFLGSFAACPYIWRHTHEYNSYADTIMPHFLFAVGFAFRLTFGRRQELQGTTAAYWRVVRRMLGLVLVSLVVYNVGPRAPSWEKLLEIGFIGALKEPLKRSWFQTLMHIAATGLWLVPVIRARTSTRVLWMVGSALAHMALSHWFLFKWNNGDPNAFKGTMFESYNWDSTGNVIDGGPFGFLTWCVPAIIGTLACDAVAGAAGRPKLAKMFGWSLVLMGIAWVMSCGTRFYDVPSVDVDALKEQRLADSPVIPTSAQIDRWIEKAQEGKWSELIAEPPFFPPPHARDKEEVDGKVKEVNHSTWYRKWNYWMMSQRSGNLSYPLFAAGFSLAVYVLFYIACDMWGWQLAFFRTFGTNALLAYIVHDLTGGAVKPFIPRDAPGWYVTAGVIIFYALSWLFVRAVEKQGAYLRV